MSLVYKWAHRRKIKLTDMKEVAVSDKNNLPCIVIGKPLQKTITKSEEKEEL